MNWVDILVVVLLSLLVVGLLAYFLIRKARGKSLTGCDCASGKGKAILKAYHDEKAKEGEGKGECPYCHK
jgi:hypothetical protein